MKVLGPKRPGDMRLGWPCAVCGHRFVVGDVTALVGEEPADAVEAERMRQDLPYVTTAKEIHAGCAPEWIRRQRREPA